MNVTITDRDKKLLGFLAAFLIALAFFMLVFRPLAQKNSELKAELKEARELEIEFGGKASDAQSMSDTEEETRQRLGSVLARFYPMQQSQNAEKKVTTLMLNHNLEIQSLTVTMPETASNLKWYQYSEAGRAAEEIPASQGEGEEETLSMYGARVVCTAEGDKQDMWELIDDITDHFPAISIVSIEWNTSGEAETSWQDQEIISLLEGGDEAVNEEETGTGEDIAAGEDIEAEEETETGEESGGLEEAAAGWEEAAQQSGTDRLTIGLEIFMCNQ